MDLVCFCWDLICLLRALISLFCSLLIVFNSSVFCCCCEINCCWLFDCSCNSLTLLAIILYCSTAAVDVSSWQVSFSTFEVNNSLFSFRAAMSDCWWKSISEKAFDESSGDANCENVFCFLAADDDVFGSSLAARFKLFNFDLLDDCGVFCNWLVLIGSWTGEKFKCRLVGVETADNERLDSNLDFLGVAMISLTGNDASMLLTSVNSCWFKLKVKLPVFRIDHLTQLLQHLFTTTQPWVRTRGFDFPFFVLSFR